VKLPLADTDLPTFTFTLLALELFDVGLQFVEVMNPVIRNTDGADLAGFLGFYKCSPCSVPAFLTAIWGVYQIPVSLFLETPDCREDKRALQVYVIQTRLLEA
jgi:hypothetical protein